VTELLSFVYVDENAILFLFVFSRKGAEAQSNYYCCFVGESWILDGSKILSKISPDCSGYPFVPGFGAKD